MKPNIIIYVRKIINGWQYRPSFDPDTPYFLPTEIGGTRLDALLQSPNFTRRTWDLMHIELPILPPEPPPVEGQDAKTRSDVDKELKSLSELIELLELQLRCPDGLGLEEQEDIDEKLNKARNKHEKLIAFQLNNRFNNKGKYICPELHSASTSVRKSIRTYCDSLCKIGLGKVGEPTYESYKQHKCVSYLLPTGIEWNFE